MCSDDLSGCDTDVLVGGSRTTQFITPLRPCALRRRARTKSYEIESISHAKRNPLSGIGVNSIKSHRRISSESRKGCYALCTSSVRPLRWFWQIRCRGSGQGFVRSDHSHLPGSYTGASRCAYLICGEGLELGLASVGKIVRANAARTAACEKGSVEKKQGITCARREASSICASTQRMTGLVAARSGAFGGSGTRTGALRAPRW